MTVREFIEMYEECSKLVSVELYEINENVRRKSDTEELRECDGLHEEWKNAKIQGWSIEYDTIYLSVIK